MNKKMNKKMTGQRGDGRILPLTSIPEKEYEEIVNKVAAMKQTLEGLE